MSSSLLIFAGHLTETQPQEIYMDVAWTAWLQVIGDERRQREMPKAQRSKGKIWNFPLGWSILIDFTFYYLSYQH